MTAQKRSHRIKAKPAGQTAERQQITYLKRGEAIEVLLTSESDETVIGYIVHRTKPTSHFAFGGDKRAAIPAWALQEITDKVKQMDYLYSTVRPEPVILGKFSDERKRG